MQRPTITDIARIAGVSKGAVSYALNDRPGVSAETRARIRAIADELGWAPNSAARALTGARASAIGLALARPARTLGIEPFFMQFISGVEAELSSRDIALLFKVVHDPHDEVATYRRWWSEHRVDGVIVTDLRIDDERLAALATLDLPAVLTGVGLEGRPHVAHVLSDNATAIAQALEHLYGLGHRRIARVAGLPQMVHTATRGRAFDSWAATHHVEQTTLFTDYTPEQGARATRELLARASRPTAIMYDNDVMAVAGLAACAQTGIRVPVEMSILAWDDSPVCEMVFPPLTAMNRDVHEWGAHVTRRLLDVIDGRPSSDLEEPPARLVVRGSTAPCPPESSAPQA